jgi:small subunit ribosomal protein S16
MRMGKKKQPTYRIVAADSRSPRDGRFLEIIGTYQPRLEPSGVKVDVERAVHWLRVGARPSETVEKLLKISGAMDVFQGTAAMPDAPVEIAPPPKNVYVAASSRVEPDADTAAAPPADDAGEEVAGDETAGNESGTEAEAADDVGTGPAAVEEPAGASDVADEAPAGDSEPAR